MISCSFVIKATTTTTTAIFINFIFYEAYKGTNKYSADSLNATYISYIEYIYLYIYILYMYMCLCELKSLSQVCSALHTSMQREGVRDRISLCSQAYKAYVTYICMYI